MSDPIGPPRWVFVWIVVVGLFVMAAAVFVAVRAQTGFDRANDNTRILHQIVQTSDRRDCVTTLSTARRSVFDNVDIYKAVEIDQLATALLAAQAGGRSTPDEVAAFQANAAKLHTSLTEARRLQPPMTLDDLIAHGGMIDGVHYSACPGG